MKKLENISREIGNADLTNILKSISELSKTGSGKIYDELQIIITKANISDSDKKYLLEEVTSWRKQLVWTSDYASAVKCINAAWISKNHIAIQAAEDAIYKLEKEDNKSYLSEK